MSEEENTNDFKVDWNDWDNKQKLKKVLSYQNTLNIATTVEKMIEIIHDTREAQSQTNQTMNMIIQRLDDIQNQINMMKIEKMGTGPTKT